MPGLVMIDCPKALLLKTNRLKAIFLTMVLPFAVSGERSQAYSISDERSRIRAVRIDSARQPVYRQG
jgi:hypothetical protein